MVLIQEMALKIDQGFLGAIIGFATPSTDPEAERQKVIPGLFVYMVVVWQLAFKNMLVCK